MISPKSIILFLKLNIKIGNKSIFRIVQCSLSFSRSGDLSSVLKLLKEVSRLPSGANWDEKCEALKNAYLH